MKLLYQTHSPYARKALVFAIEAGLVERLTVEHHETSPTRANTAVFAQNPLGKVPVLLRPGEEPIFDSNVICEYFDAIQQGPKLIPADGEPRWRALRFEAVGQGLCDSGISLRWETVRRPEGLRYPALADGLALKLNETYAWLNDKIDPAEPVTVGQIALATALAWLEFRALPSFRPFSRLSAWFDHFAERPSMLATPLTGETRD
jgi:glutathione S-transferase